MKLYTPNRTGLPPVQESKPKPQRSRTTILKRRSVQHVTAVVACFGILVIAGHQWRQYQLAFRASVAEIEFLRGNLRDAETRVSHWAINAKQAEARLADLTKTHDEALMATQQQGRELMDLQKSLKATELSLSLTQKDLVVSRERHQMLSEMRDDLEKKMRQLSERLIQILAQLGDVLVCDPWLSRDTWNHALEVARDYGADTHLLQARIERLRERSALPVASAVEGSVVAQGEHYLDATLFVRDPSDQFVHGLSRADIEVYDGERRIHAVAVREVRQRTSQHYIALLLDTSGSTSGAAHDAMKQSSLQFVRLLANPSSLRIWRFADTVESLTPWTIDAGLHQPAISALSPSGGTALYKALRLASDDLSQKNALRSIVLFTDGSDSMNEEAVEPILDRCRHHAIAIHVVALKTAETNEALLTRIATATGGTYHLVSDPSRLSKQFHEVSLSFQQPVYQIHIDEPVKSEAITVRVANLSPITLQRAH